MTANTLTHTVTKLLADRDVHERAQRDPTLHAVCQLLRFALARPECDVPPGVRAILERAAQINPYGSPHNAKVRDDAAAALADADAFLRAWHEDPSSPPAPTPEQERSKTDARPTETTRSEQAGIARAEAVIGDHLAVSIVRAMARYPDEPLATLARTIGVETAATLLRHLADRIETDNYARTLAAAQLNENAARMAAVANVLERVIPVLDELDADGQLLADVRALLGS
jgi:hypothetical protein